MSRNIRQQKRDIIVFSLLFCAAFYVLSVALFRPLWFDEALTVTSFVMLPEAKDIYFSYHIPNNHILFSIFLRIWMDISDLFLPVAPFMFRLFPVCIAMIALGTMFFLWKKRLGILNVSALLLCFILCLPFEIYASAVRGYMLSFLFIILAFEFAGLWMKRNKIIFAILYFIFSILAIGTIPSNLTALAGIVIFFFKPQKKLPDKYFVLLAAIPLLAFALFYLPIWHDLLKAAALKEGWRDKKAALMSVYGAFIFSFLPIAVPAFYGLAVRLRKREKLFPALLRSTIFLIPLPLILFMSPAPFPRIFFPLWALWIYLAGRAAEPFFRKAAGPADIKAKLASAAILCAIPVWAFAQHFTAPDISRLLSEKDSLDDYFSPYYMNKNFTPLETVIKIREIWDKRGRIPVYISFNADPYSIIFYGRFRNMEFDEWLFDKPRRRLSSLPESTLLITRDNRDLKSTLSRFDMSEQESLSNHGSYHKICLAQKNIEDKKTPR